MLSIICDFSLYISSLFFVFITSMKRASYFEPEIFLLTNKIYFLFFETISAKTLSAFVESSFAENESPYELAILAASFNDAYSAD